jgi:hypothetical protein
MVELGLTVAIHTCRRSTKNNMERQIYPGREREWQGANRR